MNNQFGDHEAMIGTNPGAPQGLIERDTQDGRAALILFAAS
jgi:hypothetical protein